MQFIEYTKKLVDTLSISPIREQNPKESAWEDQVVISFSTSNHEVLQKLYDLLDAEKMKFFYLMAPVKHTLHWYYRMKCGGPCTSEKLRRVIFEDLLTVLLKIDNNLELGKNLDMEIKPLNLMNSPEPKEGWSIWFNFNEKDLACIYTNGMVRLKPLFIIFNLADQPKDVRRLLYRELKSRNKNLSQIKISKSNYIVWYHKGLIYSKPDLYIAQRFVELEVEQILTRVESRLQYPIKDLRVEIRRKPMLYRVV